MSDARCLMEPLDGRLMLAAGVAPDTAVPTVVRVNVNRINPSVSNPFIEFTVTYRDNIKLNELSIDNKDIVITGPRRFVATVRLVSRTIEFQGRKIKARYRVNATSGPFLTAVSGNYSISLKRNQVKDTAGNAVAPKKYSIDIDIERIRELVKSFVR